MSSPRRAMFVDRTTRLLVMWLLALVLPLQGAAFGVFAAKGPAHLHTTVEARALVLDDVRRWKVSPVAATSLLASHLHAGHAAERHHHAGSDASVVVTGADAPDADEAVGTSGLSVLALIPSLVAPEPGEAAALAVRHAGWHPRTAFTVPLERPPRSG